MYSKLKEKFHLVNKCGSVILFLVQVLRYAAQIGFFGLFAFWSLKALAKFNSQPISSSVNFWIGDDNLGNFELPAVTICLGRFSYITQQPSWTSKCQYEPKTFLNALRVCTDLSTKNGYEATTTSTTSSGDLFGNIFDNDYYDTKESFENVNDFLNASFFGIDDMIKFFRLGNKILVSPTLKDNERRVYLKELFKEFVHFNKGFCHTFDPAVQNLSRVPIYVAETATDDGELIYIEFDFQFQRLFELTTDPSYLIMLHKNSNDVLDAPTFFPYLYIKPMQNIWMKLSKTTLKTLSTEDRPCLEEGFKGIEECLIERGNHGFENEYGCRMPWSQSKLDLCQVGQHNQSLKELVNRWQCFKNEHSTSDCSKNQDRTLSRSCKSPLNCKRSIYEVSYQPLAERISGVNRSLLKIQVSSPYVQVMKDSRTYDFQSFIGEVGGTLGLTLGLSFLSLVNLLEYFVTKLFPKQN